MKFAVKRLTKTDLSFFEPQYRRLNKRSGQKSINLNRNPFVDVLYPDLPDVMAGRENGLEVALRIAGPGVAHREVRITRKIAKGQGYKNYRLNGEFVKNPEDAEHRFDRLQAGDVAVFGFEGVGRPELLRLFVLSAAEPDDVAVLETLRPTESQSMVAVTAETLAAAILLAPASHPLHDLFLDPADAADLEEAALGDAAAARRLLSRPGRRRVAAAQLAEARRRAEEIGRDGEQLIADHFERGGKDILSWTWRSAENAISPWDFDLGHTVGEIRVEVKSTGGAHGAPFHISMAELLTASEPPRYDLYRVCGLGPDGGRLRIAENIGEFARMVLATLSDLPAGVRPDAFTVDPALLTWSAPIHLDWLEVDEGDD